MMTFADLEGNDFVSIGSIGKEVIIDPVPLTGELIADVNTDLGKYNYEDVVTELLHNNYIVVDVKTVGNPAAESFRRVNYGTINKRTLVINTKFKFFYTEDN